MGQGREEFLLRIEFKIPEDHWPYVLDWSYGNLSKLYEIGYDAGLSFCEKHGAKLKRAGGRVAQAQIDRPPEPPDGPPAAPPQ